MTARPSRNVKTSYVTVKTTSKTQEIKLENKEEQLEPAYGSLGSERETKSEPEKVKVGGDEDDQPGQDAHGQRATIGRGAQD